MHLKQLTTLLLLTLSLNAFSQIKKGQWLIGGNAAFSYAKSKELKMTTLQFSPSSGYFLIDKLVGGLRVDYTSDTYDWSDKRKFTTMSISPFVRYYFLANEQKVNFFTDAAYGFAWGKYKNISYPSSHVYRYNTLSFMAGPAIFLNERTALEVTVGYTHSTRGPIDSTVTNKIQVGIGLQIHIGKQKD